MLRIFTACCFLALLASEALSQSIIQISSPEGEYIGRGFSQQLVGNFTQSIGEKRITLSHPEGYSFTFQPGHERRFERGAYLFARSNRFNFNPVTPPIMHISNDRRDCYGAIGMFYIHEINTTGFSPSLALDAIHFCSESAKEPLIVQIRINSTLPVDQPPPIAAVRVLDMPISKGMVQLDGRYSLAKDASFKWTQLSGLPAVIHSPDQSQTWLSLPEVSEQNQELQFRLEVKDELGRVDEHDFSLELIHDQHLISFVTVIGEAGDFISAGRNYYFSPSTSLIDPRVTSYGDYQKISFSLRDESSWSLDFRSAQHELLAVGDYQNAERAAFAPASQPGFSFSGGGRGCNTLHAQFSISDLVMVGNELERFVARFSQSCTNKDNPGLRGFVSYNAPLASPPIADAGPSIQTVENSLITLNAGGSSGGKTELYQFEWLLLEGENVLYRATNPVVSLRLGRLNSGFEQANLTARLIVTNLAGFRSMAETSVVVTRDESNLTTPLPSESPSPSPTSGPAPSLTPSPTIGTVPSASATATILPSPDDSTAPARPRTGGLSWLLSLLLLVLLSSKAGGLARRCP